MKKILGGILIFISPMFSQASCIKVTSTSSLSSELIAAGYTAGSWTGACNQSNCTGNAGLQSVISISSNDNFMPSGSLLGSATSSFLTAGASIAYTQNQILFRCDIADADSLYEIYGTNSTYDYTGAQEVEDIERAYFTYLSGVALRFTNMETGEYYSAYWQSKKFDESNWVESGDYIYIPASAFSDIKTEIFKTTAQNYTGSSVTSNRYFYNQQLTQGLVAFRGPGLSTSSIVDGTHIGNNHPGWYTNYPGGFSLYGITFIKGAACVIEDYPSTVILPNTSVPALNSDQSSQQLFSISLSCEDSAVSSVSTSTTSSANVAMGFLVNQSTAVTAATNLGLVTSNGGLTHLLDTNYGSSGVASGVGIKIYDESGTALNLLTSTTPATGNTGGWYAYKDLTTSQGDSTDGITTYTGNFTASLEAISGETVTAGSVNAQLQVVVSFQ